MTDILVGELFEMATFKLQETVKTVRMLAKETDVDSVRQLLTDLAIALDEHTRKLRVAAGKLDRYTRSVPVKKSRKRTTTKLTLAPRR